MQKLSLDQSRGQFESPDLRKILMIARILQHSDPITIENFFQ